MQSYRMRVVTFAAESRFGTLMHLLGFIMAEVMSFSDLKELGSEANVKALSCRVLL